MNEKLQQFIFPDDHELRNMVVSFLCYSIDGCVSLGMSDIGAIESVHCEYHKILREFKSNRIYNDIFTIQSIRYCESITALLTKSVHILSLCKSFTGDATYEVCNIYLDKTNAIQNEIQNQVTRLILPALITEHECEDIAKGKLIIGRHSRFIQTLFESFRKDYLDLNIF
jgi:hypothetical protein